MTSYDTAIPRDMSGTSAFSARANDYLKKCPQIGTLPSCAIRAYELTRAPAANRSAATADPAAIATAMTAIAIRRSHPAPPPSAPDTPRQLASSAIPNATIAQHMSAPHAFAAAGTGRAGNGLRHASNAFN